MWPPLDRLEPHGVEREWCSVPVGSHTSSGGRWARRSPPTPTPPPPGLSGHEWSASHQQTTALPSPVVESVTVTHPYHPLFGQQVAVIRVRRGVDPDLIIRLPDGYHGAIAASWPDSAGAPVTARPAPVAPPVRAPIAWLGSAAWGPRWRGPAGARRPRRGG